MSDNPCRIIQLMKEVFSNWKREQLSEIVKICNNSGRSYGELDELQKQYDVLKERFADLSGKDEASKWLKPENVY